MSFERQIFTTRMKKRNERVIVLIRDNPEDHGIASILIRIEYQKFSRVIQQGSGCIP